MKLFTIDLGEEEISRYHIAIGGFRGCPTGDAIQSLLDKVKALEDGRTVLAVQVFNAERIATHLHLLVSTLYALQAFRDSRGISNTLRTEILLYSSAQRQIADAIDKTGVGPRSASIAAVVISLNSDAAVNSIRKIKEITGATMDDTVLGINENGKPETIMRIFKIDDAELESAKMGMTQADIESAITKRIMSRISIMAISK